MKSGRPRYSNAEVHFQSLVDRQNHFIRMCGALCVIGREWTEIVGRRLAEQSAPSEMDNDVLIVRTSSQAAYKDLNFKKSAIILEIDKRSGLTLKDLAVEIGQVPRSAVKRCRPGKPKKRIIAVDEALTVALAAEITREREGVDDDLAAVIARCRAVYESSFNSNETS